MDTAFNEYFLRSNLTSSQTIQLLNISPTTFKRYLRTGAPTAVLLALQWRAGLNPEWPGFRIVGKEIITPAGDTIHRNQVESFKWGLQLQYRQGWLDAEAALAREKAGNLRSFPKFQSAAAAGSQCD